MVDVYVIVFRYGRNLFSALQIVDSSNASFTPPTELGIKRSSSNPAHQFHVSSKSVPRQSSISSTTVFKQSTNSTLRHQRLVFRGIGTSLHQARLPRLSGGLTRLTGQLGCLDSPVVMPNMLGNWRSYRLSTPATALRKQMFSSNGRTVASQLTQPPQHTATNIPFYWCAPPYFTSQTSQQPTVLFRTYKLFRRSGLSLK
ncbi:uncharacterized protein LOC111866291 isoform X1 [Cryptotermes secundus]|uniref:uncharacterized protein LOC111866291 isoform X1 n=1 Tax=Cryptotermes secundus TaxID=105785 RepID=UPI001454B925|nr:uncharacterized protein LOC111866291 isoform X1 [Cryptotermes secundus]